MLGGDIFQANIVPFDRGEQCNSDNFFSVRLCAGHDVLYCIIKTVRGWGENCADDLGTPQPPSIPFMIIQSNCESMD